MRLLLVGDVMLGRLVNEVLRQEPPEYPWGDTLSIFQESDLRICNLECVISDRGIPWSYSPKVFHFRSDAKNIKVLQAARIDAVSLANNHTLDYEYDAMFEMLSILKKAKIAFAGAGANFTEAAKLALIEVGSKKIGMLAFTDNEPVWEAKQDRPGIFYAPVTLSDSRAKTLFSLVRRSKESVDVLIVSAHWGPNWGYRPSKSQILFAHALIDAGADIIFGHSGHVFRGIEIYHDRPILYCTGDFIDDYAVDEIERNDQSFLYQIEFAGKIFKCLTLYPTMIQNFQARLAPPQEEGRTIAQKMKELCLGFGTKALWQEAAGNLEIRMT